MDLLTIIEILRNTSTLHNCHKTATLYQLQLDGLKEDWLIYPTLFNPLTLVIKRKTK
ncbi:hypothetical protein MUP77_05570 [Candidatus Bathyarchaeota archaeon]|nr:hypothetical protein [Candidatus Bathyarchaeota archaeon]